MLQAIAQAIYDKKGVNIIAIDVKKSSSLTDYFLIAEGSVERHVSALASSVKETVKEMGGHIFHIDGDQLGDWVVMDCGQILIHLFVPALRDKYSLEELWHDGEIVDLNIQIKEA
ncbi:ribosome silencing factor [Waddlia chondrophila]|nr:ribosome silencing factor [Waddlia chondrophila]